MLCERASQSEIRHSKIRSVYWKIFLSYLPLDSSQWNSILALKRDKYDTLCDTFSCVCVRQRIFVINALTACFFARRHLEAIPTKENNPAINLLLDNPLSQATGV